MHEQFAQGDLLIERVDANVPTGVIVEPERGVTVLAEGEATGHRHAIYDAVIMFRDDSLARDIPSDLYAGHLQVQAAFARVEHDEHDTITLPRGTYRMTRQRELEPKDAQLIAD